MDLKAEKLHLIEWITKLTDASVIKKIKALRAGEENRVSIEQYNRDLDEADASIDRGEFYTQEEVEKRSKTW